MNIISTVIPVGQTTSSAVPVPEYELLCAISLPAAGFTGATVSYEISFDNGVTFLPVQAQDGASVFTTTVGATARYVPVNPNVFLASCIGYRCLLRCVSSTAELTANKTVNFHFRPLR